MRGLAAVARSWFSLVMKTPPLGGLLPINPLSLGVAAK
jgi:hypothetical protein